MKSVRNKILHVSLASSIFLFGNALFGQNIERLDALFENQKNKGQFNGGVMVLKNDKVIYSRFLGPADFTTNRELNESSVFEFASSGKIFTAVAIGQLANSGKLDLDGAVADYVNPFPYKDVTVKMLLQHTSGLPDYISFFEANWEADKRAYNSDVLEWLSDKKPELKFESGDKWEYSNTGYVVLASVVEKVSGLSFTDYLERNIFAPLEMTTCLPYRQKWHESVQLNGYTFGHRPDDSGEFKPVNKSLESRSVYQYSLRGIDGDGNVVGTLADFAKFDQGWNRDKLQLGKIKNLFMQPTRLNNGKSHNYGFAFYVSDDKNSAWHYGSVPGYQSYYKKFLDKNVTVIYMKNIETYDWSWLQILDEIVSSD